MDIGIFYSLSAILLPLFYALYLLIARIRLSLVPKGVFNYALIFINSISLALYCYLFYYTTKEKIEISNSFNVLSLDKFSFDFGFLLNETNLKMLIFSSVIYLLVSVYSRFYFEKKKQFIFTKQRFYIFLSFLIFNTYSFLVSPNLFQGFIFWILQGLIIFIFSYFDIFKVPTNFNITRFARISAIGDFSFLLVILILFKYAVLSQGCIKSLSLQYSELNPLVNYMFGIADLIELKIFAIVLIVAIMTKMFIFPFNCYYSFFANSSNIFYLSIATCANCVLGTFLFLKSLSLAELFVEYSLYFKIFVLLTIAISFLFILFEKNYKIIFGQILSIVSAGFIYLFLEFKLDLVLYVYFVSCFLITIILMFLFLNDKVGFNRRLINKQKGFVLERVHIFLFEKMPEKIFVVVNFLDEKIIQNISSVCVFFFSYFISLFNIRTVKNESFKALRNILIVFAIFTIFAIFLALFGRFK